MNPSKNQVYEPIQCADPMYQLARLEIIYRDYRIVVVKPGVILRSTLGIP